MEVAQALPVDEKVEHVVALPAHLQTHFYPVQFRLRAPQKGNDTDTDKTNGPSSLMLMNKYFQAGDGWDGVWDGVWDGGHSKLLI